MWIGLQNKNLKVSHAQRYNFYQDLDLCLNALTKKGCDRINLTPTTKDKIVPNKVTIRYFKMVSLQNIQSLTDFRHNAKKYVEQLQATQAPLVLTVNGKAAVVVEAAEAYEAYQTSIRELEAEVNALKLQTLKEAVAIGAQQAEQGQFSQRSFDEIIAAARSDVSNQPAS